VLGGFWAMSMHFVGGRPVLCDSALHQSAPNVIVRHSLFSTDGPAEHNADAQGKQGGYPHPTHTAAILLSPMLR